MSDDDTPDEPHASSSGAQSDAEAEVLRYASEHFGRRLRPSPLRTPSGQRVKVDGVAEDGSVLVEVYVRQTPLLPGNKRKIMTDALRLTWFRTFFPTTPTVALCLSSLEAARSLMWDEMRQKWPGWAAEALHDLGVQVLVFPLDDDGAVRRAADRQSW